MTLPKSAHHVLFLDIECVPAHESYYDLEPGMKALWDKKAQRFVSEWDDRPDYLYDTRSWIFAEFWKIVCISVWYLHTWSDGSFSFRVRSFAHDNEHTVLTEFFALLHDHYSLPHHKLCGHNIKEFDVPYLCRRAIINGLWLPPILTIQDKKPRETPFIDTMDIWKFGERKHFVSLDLLTRVLWLPTPKIDISWEQVARVYRDDKDLPRIVSYCERDVVAVTKVHLMFSWYQGISTIDRWVQE
jgi:predicted PolB exonuclease-like 3'-5' exonuclease